MTMQDFEICKAKLKGKKDVTFKSFPSLNHLMMTGTGTGISKPDEYQIEGHVTEEVIDAIVKFVLD